MPDQPDLLAPLVSAQARWTTLWHEADAPESLSGLALLVRENHRRNFDLWHEEDQARRDDLGAEHVWRAKRSIDRLNQERNNFVEQIDEHLLGLAQPHPEVALNSETRA